MSKEALPLGFSPARLRGGVGRKTTSQFPVARAASDSPRRLRQFRPPASLGPRPRARPGAVRAGLSGLQMRMASALKSREPPRSLIKFRRPAVVDGNVDIA